MHTTLLTPERLAASVWAVPPLARNPNYSLNLAANRQMISHLEAGGITTLLYGGNAVFYHIALSEYRAVLEALISAASDATLIVPSVGPLGLPGGKPYIVYRSPGPSAGLSPQRFGPYERGKLADSFMQ